MRIFAIQELYTLHNLRPKVQNNNNNNNKQVFVIGNVFVPVAAETMGAINEDEMNFLSDTGRRITQSTDDHRESAFLFQRLSVLLS